MSHRGVKKKLFFVVFENLLYQIWEPKLKQTDGKTEESPLISKNRCRKQEKNTGENKKFLPYS